MTGQVYIVGLGPGGHEHTTPAATDALARSRHLVGYGPYLARVDARVDQVRHGSDNRKEANRARHALDLARNGETVAVVSSGDAGVFAMAATLFEAIDAEPDAWPGVELTIVPGVTAMVAAAARLGAPLGHDFAAISLSDNLKPWETVLKRIDAAAEADFVLALYNPISRARPWQLGAAFDRLRALRPGTTPVMFATAVSRPDESIEVTTLAGADPERADMRTLVIVGSSATRRIDGINGKSWVYTPRRAEPAS